MSDIEDGMEDDVDIQDNENEVEILCQRALIETVRPCPALYAKNKKEYSGKNFNKDLAWDTVGSAQIPPMLGKDAKSKFYKIRQKFGKEWRKYMAHNKGKSGQGAKGPFKSKWPLFDDCAFLQAHIQPRKTASTYAAKKSTITAPLHRSSPTMPSPSPSPDSMSSLWSSDMALFHNSAEETSEEPANEARSPLTSPSPSSEVLKCMKASARASQLLSQTILHQKREKKMKNL